MSKIKIIFLTVVAIAMVATALVLRVQQATPAMFRDGIISYNGKDLPVLVADSPTALIQGLSDRDNLGKYAGMYFVFSGRGNHQMVMRRMRFPLDMAWINDGIVVDIKQNLPPDPSPTEAGLKVYGSEAPDTAVLELPAGFISKNPLKPGDQVVLK